MIIKHLMNWIGEEKTMFSFGVFTIVISIMSFYVF